MQWCLLGALIILVLRHREWPLQTIAAALILLPSKWLSSLRFDLLQPVFSSPTQMLALPMAYIAVQYPRARLLARQAQRALVINQLLSPELRCGHVDTLLQGVEAPGELELELLRHLVIRRHIHSLRCNQCDDPIHEPLDPSVRLPAALLGLRKSQLQVSRCLLQLSREGIILQPVALERRDLAPRHRPGALSIEEVVIELV